MPKSFDPRPYPWTTTEVMRRGKTLEGSCSIVVVVDVELPFSVVAVTDGSELSLSSILLIRVCVLNVVFATSDLDRRLVLGRKLESGCVMEKRLCAERKLCRWMNCVIMLITPLFAGGRKNKEERDVE